MTARKLFHDSVTPLPATPGAIHRSMMIAAAAVSQPDEVMRLLFSLAIPADAAGELEQKVARGEVVHPRDLRASYAVPRERVTALTNWLKDQGFEVTGVSRDGTSVYAQATVSQIERSLEVSMVRVTRSGLTYTAARNAPSLPADVGEAVHAIIGLQPFRQVHKHSRKTLPRQHLASPAEPPAASTGPGADAATPQAGGTIPHRPPYLVQDLLGAYNAASAGVTGKGQTIAIIIDTLPQDSDVQSFWEQNGLAVDLARVEKINVRGAVLPAPDGEETLDVQWASGIAPGAHVRVYATGTLQLVDLNLALDRIIEDLESQPGMRQVSMSMGMGEVYLEPGRAEVAAQHQKFLRLAAAGVNVFVSSGDAGSNPDETSQNPTGPTQAEYASSDTAVVGVGGTTLALSGDGSVSAETGWTGSGGGKSIFFSRPVWQSSLNVPGTQRLVPDVSLAADPNAGALVVLQGVNTEWGGTSWAAPVWAGFCALINEARLNQGKPALPFLNPLIYPLMGTAAFRDITQGTNGAYDAGPGYDMLTGIGVPDVAALIQALP